MFEFYPILIHVNYKLLLLAALVSPFVPRTHLNMHAIHCAQPYTNEQQTRETEVWIASERKLQIHFGSSSFFLPGSTLPATLLLSRIVSIRPFFALVGGEQVWLQKDNGRLPRVERVQTPCIDLWLRDSYLRSTPTDEGLRRRGGVQRCHKAI